MLEDIKNKKTVVVGAGETGVAAANFLSDKCARVILNDRKKLNQENIMLDKRVEIVDGGHSRVVFENADMVVLSPGVDRRTLPLPDNIYVIGDVELFYHYNKSKIISITGTNGKTTTTYLAGEILKKKYNVFVGGNIGVPLFEVFQMKNCDISILELSSFQLENIDAFVTDIGVILNITPDHLDRYESFDEYKRAKLNLFKNQKSNQIVILNGEDENLKEIVISGEKILFKKDEFIKNNKITAYYKDREVILEIDKIKLKGKHFYEDIYVAVLLGLILNVEKRDIEEVIYGFKGLEHRLEFVTEKNGVTFYNDSKSTTISSTCRAVESFNLPVILILGGIHKGEDFKMLLKYKNLKKIICFGDAKEIIIKSLIEKQPVVAENLENAVELAVESADIGDIVLFSPGCSSFDMFKNYIERGKKFKELVA